MIRTSSSDLCRVVLVHQIDRGRYKLKHPIKVWYVKEADGSYSGIIHELEILCKGRDSDEALYNAFSEMLTLYEFITRVPLSYVFNDEILFYRYFLNSHIIKI